MIQFLKYVTARLFLGTFVSVFAAFGVLVWVHEVFYPRQQMEDTRLIIALYLVILLAVSALMSLWGRWRFRNILRRELKRMSAQYHPKILVRSYQRCTRYLGSCYFFNTTRVKLSRIPARRFGEILLGMKIEDDQALAVYEELLLLEPGRQDCLDFLLGSYLRRSRLSDRSWNFFRRWYHEKSDDRLVRILTREYMVRSLINFESERVFERCLEVCPGHRKEVLDFLMPRLLQFNRMDDNAVRFYLAARESIPHREWAGEVDHMLSRVDQRYRERSRADFLARQVHQAVTTPRPAEGPKIPEPAAPEISETVSGENGTFSFQIREEAGDSARDIPLEGLIFEREEKETGADLAAGRVRLSPGSRLHGLLLSFLGQGRQLRPGLYRKWLGLIILIILAAVFLYLGFPLGDLALKKLSAPESPPAGQPGVLPSRPEKPSRIEDRRGWYTIQIGAFKDSANAALMAETLNRQGVESYLLLPGPKERKIYRVRIGAFPTESAARARAVNLAKDNLIKEWRISPYLAPAP